ncbi:MAG: deoxyribonuclease IV [Desulfobacterales bacterium]
MDKNLYTKGLLGAHLSMAKGFDKAVYEAHLLGCSVLQIFTKNATSWKERDISDTQIKKFEKAKHETGIHTIASHTSYLINPASKDPAIREKSVLALKNELLRSGKLKISYVVLHPGAHNGAGEKEGIRRIRESLDIILSEIFVPIPLILLETTAGQGTSLGYQFEQLASIMEKVSKPQHLGICLDTSHIFAAGYDIRTDESYNRTMEAFNSAIGFEYLRLFHLNDSKKDLGSGIDRHEHIGQGFIGTEAFKCIMNDPRFFHIPKVIETPKENEMDRVNLDLLRKLMF